MKISPVASSANSVSGTAPESHSGLSKLRSIRMATDQTPGGRDPLTIPDTNDPGDVATEETKPLSPQMAALAKQRRALQQERQALEREKAALKTPTQGSSVDAARLKSDPLGVLLEAGVTYDQLTEAVLAREGDSPTRALEQKLKALEESLEKKFTDRDSQQEQQVLAEMGREAKQLVAEGDEFELVRATKSIPDVLKLIERNYRETGEVLEVREALRLYEEELFKDISPLASLSKVQKAFAPPPAPPQQQQRQMRTLTNRDTASVPTSAKARALAAFHGTLKR